MVAIRDGAPAVPAEPDGASRLAGLDVLRGLAILGILFMNVNLMGGTFYGRYDPRNFGWTGADRLAWALQQVFLDGTARCMLEMLFGVGMMILTERAGRLLDDAAMRPASPVARLGRRLFGPAAVLRGYYWRNLVLFLFGAVHATILMWPGDILHFYGLAAMVAFLFRRLGPKTLLAFGLSFSAFLLIGGGLDIYAAHSRSASAAATPGAASAAKPHATDLRPRRDAARPTPREKLIQAENRERSAVTGTGMTWFAALLNFQAYLYGGGSSRGSIVVWNLMPYWEPLATMLIGAALFRWGVVQGQRSRRFYGMLMVAGYAVGLGLRLASALQVIRFPDQPDIWGAASDIARLAVTLGHLSLVWLLLGTARGARLLRPFEAAGRTALSIYIAQTLIGMWVLFPPFGFGLYGKLGWLDYMLVAVAIDAVLCGWPINGSSGSPSLPSNGRGARSSRGGGCRSDAFIRSGRPMRRRFRPRHLDAAARRRDNRDGRRASRTIVARGGQDA